MTLAEIKNQIMFQTNNDAEDLGDYEPHINDYVNEGYDRLVSAWFNGHVPTVKYDKLEMDVDEPITPEWTHRCLCDWATWLIYRNGNPQKQQRGMAYRSAFEEMLAKIIDEGGESGMNEDGTRKVVKNFYNIPT